MNDKVKNEKMKTALDFHPEFFNSLKTYSKERFFKDLMAGLIVGIVALPLAIAFGFCVYLASPHIL